MTQEPTDLEALADHIERRHHGYVRDHVIDLAQRLDVLAQALGAAHPELPAVALRFHGLGRELSAHFAKEEHLLFPYVRALARAAREGERGPASPFGTVRNPIRMMEADHEHATDVLDELRRITRDYAAPAGAPEEYRTCMTNLARFDEDLREHIHLEDDLLFPQASELEDRLACV